MPALANFLTRTFTHSLAPTLLLGLAASAAQAQSATICHVTDTATAGSSGADWSTAMPLQEALGKTDGSCVEIWVKHGTYKPTTGTDRTISFAINRPLKLYGGFAGTERTLAQRVLNPGQATVLSGDLGSDDAAGLQGINLRTHTTRLDNSYHVVVIGGLDSSNGNHNYTPANTVLDGLTITAANVNVPGGHPGGGLVCNGSGVDKECSPTITHATFSSNSALSGGAVAFQGNSNPVISEATFSRNFSTNFGGAIHNALGTSTITNTTFSENYANYGGAIYNDSNGILSATANVTFSNNSASNSGGAILSNGRLTINDATFSGNSSGNVGGAINSTGSGSTITSAVFSDNSATMWGGAIYIGGSGSTITNATFSRNKSTSNSGGAIFIAGPNSTITHATFLENSAKLFGGAIQLNALNLVITNATFWRNFTDGDGGAIYSNYGSPAITHSTFSNNSAGRGGAIGSDQYSNPAISASILWGNTATAAPQIYNPGNASTVSYSLVQGGWSGSGSNNLGKLAEHDPRLSALADHGGPTHTMLPAAGSFAIDAYVCSEVNGTPATDQRGVSRPQGNSATPCDIGAVELLSSRDISGTPDSPSAGISGTLSSDDQCVLNSYQFSSPAGAAPSGMRFEGEQLGWEATGCNPAGGGQATITLNLPSPAPANAVLYKFYDGKWNDWSGRATFTNGRRTVTYSVTDNVAGGGDSDPRAGIIRDPAILMVPLAAGGGVDAIGIPTLSQWGVLATSLLLAAAAGGQHLRTRRDIARRT